MNKQYIVEHIELSEQQYIDFIGVLKTIPAKILKESKEYRSLRIETDEDKLIDVINLNEITMIDHC